MGFEVAARRDRAIDHPRIDHQFPKSPARVLRQRERQ
jgi:hypothetical protein